MREIEASGITAKVKELCQEANFNLGKDVVQALQQSFSKEASPLGQEVLAQILENARKAEAEGMPMCQDTGFAVVFLELGQDVHITGGDLTAAVNEGVAQGYTQGYLRKSIVDDPFKRKNTGNNTPAIIHTTVVPGESLKIIVAPKGGGSENMSMVKMLPPSAGQAGVMKLVVEQVKQAGANPCPPIIVGVGVGGTFEMAALIAKKALLRELGQPNPDAAIAAWEQEMLTAINSLGIGPQGFGGRVTALAVHVETYPCHIASLPVAVNINCHAARHKEAVI